MTLPRRGGGDRCRAAPGERGGKWEPGCIADSLSGTVSVIDLPSRTVTKTLTVGRDPAAVALTPNGTRLFVANAASDTVTIFNTATDTIQATADLSNAGRSPRGLAITNDGDADNTDETVFVSMFFSELRPGKSGADEGQDDQREGRVAVLTSDFGVPMPAPNPVTLGPMADTGFNSNGRLAPASGTTPAIASTNPATFTTPTGAFPNQLAAVAIHPSGNRAYVVNTAASPNGPLRFNSNVQGLVSVLDTATRTEITSGQTAASVQQTAPLNLNRGVNFLSAPRLFLSNPVAMAWRPDGSDAWVMVQNSDVVVRVTVDANGIPTAGLPLSARGPNSHVRVDLQNVSGGQIPGKAPQGIVINAAGNRAFVFNYVSRSVSVIDISNPSAPVIVATTPSTALPVPGTQEAETHHGRELFFTGRGPQNRMSSESWGGCVVCHPGGRSDNVTWMFDTGPRQTIWLDGMYNKTSPADQRVLNWSAVRDENHDFELNTRGVFGGRGLIDDDRLFFAIGGSIGGGARRRSLSSFIRPRARWTPPMILPRAPHCRPCRRRARTRRWPPCRTHACSSSAAGRMRRHWCRG